MILFVLFVSHIETDWASWWADSLSVLAVVLIGKAYIKAALHVPICETALAASLAASFNASRAHTARRADLAAAAARMGRASALESLTTIRMIRSSFPLGGRPA